MGLKTRMVRSARALALQELADTIVQIYSKAADFDAAVAVPFSYQYSVR
jgi:hypothetical protein